MTTFEKVLWYVLIAITTYILIVATVEWKEPSYVDFIDQAKAEVLQEIRRETAEGRVFLVCDNDSNKCIKFIPRKGDKSINVEIVKGDKK